MKTSPDSPWPPLIPKGAVPRLVRVRDFVLTLIAWLVLLYLVRDLLRHLWNWVSPAHLAAAPHAGPDWSAIWDHLSSFIYLAVLLVVWLAFWGVVRRRDLRRTKDSKQPASITVDELAELRRLNPERLRRFQGEKIVEVHFDAEHRATSITPVSLPGAGGKMPTEPLRGP